MWTNAVKELYHQNQNSLLVKRKTDNTTPWVLGLTPSSHKRSKFTQSSYISAEEIRESGRAFQFHEWSVKICKNINDQNCFTNLITILTSINKTDVSSSTKRRQQQNSSNNNRTRINENVSHRVRKATIWISDQVQYKPAETVREAG